jgi:hypothetical protein
MKVNITSDKYMTYNYALHQYVLTRDAAMTFLGIDLYSIYSSQQVANAELINQAMQVYSWLYDQLQPGAKRNVEYLIATGDPYREAMFKALLGQCEYAVASSGNEVSLQHGIQLSKGTVVPVETLRGRLQVSLKTEQAINSVGLLYTGQYRWKVPDRIYRKGY